MRLDFQSPKTYIVLMSCFFLGFFSFFLVRAISLPMAWGKESDATATSALLKGTDLAAVERRSTQPIVVTTGAASPGSAGQATPSATSSPATPKTTATGTGTPGTAAQKAGQAPAIAPSTSPSPQVSPNLTPPSIQTIPVPSNPSLATLQPPYEVAWADPSNYGDRLPRDVSGKPVNNRPIIVLHETVSSADSTIEYFKNFHSQDADQASYHTMIRRDGTVVYLVPPDKRAYGAGNSVFVNGDGDVEAVKTHKQFPPSVNNFAYHISLESPPDGYGEEEIHSGYTQAQYDSLAWLIGQSTVPLDRITTHRSVDRSKSRIDPRSFEVDRLVTALRAYR